MAGVDQRVVIADRGRWRSGTRIREVAGIAGRARGGQRPSVGARDGSGSGSAAADGCGCRDHRGGRAGRGQLRLRRHRRGRGIDREHRAGRLRAVHGVVSNAGILRDTTFAKMTDEQWDAVLQVHLYGGYHITRAHWPHPVSNSSGGSSWRRRRTGLYGNFRAGQPRRCQTRPGRAHQHPGHRGREHDIRANAVAPIVRPPA